VAVNGKTITIMGQERGPGQHDREPMICEWTIGPYFREVVLDEPVDGLLTNATYGNGVLVLNMAKQLMASRCPPILRSTDIDATRGERIGHKGSDIRPASS
jgi:HSP20 family molecular chaperone IbpA